MASSSTHFLNIESFVQHLDNQQLWNDLKHRDDPDKQISASKRFKSLLLSFSTSISTEKEWYHILTSIDERIKKYLFSDFPHEIIGGILLISELIQLITNVSLSSIDESKKTTTKDTDDILQEFFSRYATYLEEVLKKCHTHDDRYKSNTISVIALCTQTLGNLVPFAGNNIAKRTVETDIKQALKWISSSYNKQVHYQHKIAAVWILCEYAISIPILFNVHINEIIITIVNAIRDKHELVRIGGCKVLKECLKLISKRPHREQTSLSSRITTDAYQGLLNYHSSNIGVKHGSLLTFQCVLNYCINNDERIVKIDFKQLCE